MNIHLATLGNRGKEGGLRFLNGPYRRDQLIVCLKRHGPKEVLWARYSLSRIGMNWSNIGGKLGV